jgi:hypothetical protein
MKVGCIIREQTQTKAHFIMATVVDWVDMLKADSFVTYNRY